MEIEKPFKYALAKDWKSYIALIIVINLVSIILAVTNNKIWFDEDTLRFFFSAIFQGFSALFGILIVAFIFLIDKIDQKISSIERDIIFLDEKQHDLPPKIYEENTIQNIRRKTILENRKFKGKKSVIFDFISLILVLFISIIGLVQVWNLKTYVFWNIYLVSLTVFLSFFTIGTLGETIYAFLFLEEPFKSIRKVKI